LISIPVEGFFGSRYWKPYSLKMRRVSHSFLKGTQRSGDQEQPEPAHPNLPLWNPEY
jgi:hypothetical protein